MTLWHAHNVYFTIRDFWGKGFREGNDFGNFQPFLNVMEEIRKCNRVQTCRVERGDFANESREKPQNFGE